MKKLFKITLITLFTSSIFFACSKDEIKTQETEKVSSNHSVSKLASTSCDILGSLNVGTGSYTYTYTNNTNNVNINWAVTPSTAANITSGQGTSTITITFNTSCILSAYGKGGNDDCQKTISITKSPINGGGTSCDCPNPKIRSVLAVSGGHPYWRFQLDNLQSGDTFVWSQNHAPIFGSLTATTYVIANPDGPLYSGFTIYCEVSRRCTNGVIKKRKAFYTNYYGGTTTTGTTGFQNIGGSCDSNVNGGLD